MSEFVGRTGSKRVYSYPESRRTGLVGPFARNFATGPKVGTAVGLGVQIPWNAIDVGPSPSVNVPITPKSTGIVIVSGVVSVHNGSGSPLTEVIVSVQVEGVFVPAQASFGSPTLDNNGSLTIPFLAETTAIETPVGVTKHIQIFVDGNGATLLAEASALEVQEVPASTG